jgi:hypothetical protein
MWASFRENLCDDATISKLMQREKADYLWTITRIVTHNYGYSSAWPVSHGSVGAVRRGLISSKSIRCSSTKTFGCMLIFAFAIGGESDSNNAASRTLNVRGQHARW